MPPIRLVPRLPPSCINDEKTVCATPSTTKEITPTSFVDPELPLPPLTDLEDEDEGKGTVSVVTERRRSTRRSSSTASPYSSSHLGRATRNSRSKPNITKTIFDLFPKPEPIIVDGIQLTPTAVFNVLWYFANERSQIHQRRLAGQLFPWTDDKILQTYAFCNPFRVLDRTSQFFISQVVEKGDQKLEELVFRILLFSTFSKIETWQWLEEHFGSITWKDFEREKYLEALQTRLGAGYTLYTGAYQKPGPRWGGTTMENHMELIELWMDDGIPAKLRKCTNLSKAYELLAAYQGMGPFNTYQLVLNLSYSSVLNFSGKDFVVPGIGAESGLKKLFGGSIEKATEKDTNFRVAVLRYLMDNQEYHFRRLGLKFSGLGPDKLMMDLADIEHVVCEVDKYTRKSHPRIKGNGKTELRNLYHSSEARPVTEIIPQAWSHLKRQIIVPCNILPKIDKRYTIEKILAHGYVPGEGLKFNVRWLGYAPKYDEWVRVGVLFEDAPDLVNAYWKAATGKIYKSKRRR